MKTWVNSFIQACRQQLRVLNGLIRQSTPGKTKLVHNFNIILKWRSRQFHVHCTYRAYALGECNGLWWITFAFGWPGNLEFCRKVMLGSCLFSSWVLLANTNKNQTKKGAWDQAQQCRKAKNGVREGERVAEPGDMPLMVRHSMIPDYLALWFFCLRWIFCAFSPIVETGSRLPEKLYMLQLKIKFR